MSGTAPPPRMTVSTGPGTAQGMVAPADFVQPNGDLTAISFRFLNSLFTAVHMLQTQVAALQGAVQALQPPEASH